MKKEYVKKSSIWAEQFDGSKAMAEKYNVVSTTVGDDYGVPGGPLMLYTITTLEGGLRIQIGDWIATGVNGEHWPIQDKIFKATYEPVE